MFWLMMACTEPEPAPLARVQACDTDPDSGADSAEPLLVDSAGHTGDPAPSEHTGQACAASAGLGWQVIDWVPQQVVNLEITPPGSYVLVGSIEAPIGEESDVCAATCSEAWAVPVVSRPGGSCVQDPAALPMEGVDGGQVVQVCVVVYEPTGARTADCEISASGGVASFVVRAN